MTARELRIGNHIRCKHFIMSMIGPHRVSELDTIVKGITEEGINPWLFKGAYVTAIRSTPFRALSGIPLTEEWLLKLGFVNESKYDWETPRYSNGNFNISPIDTKFFKAEYTLQAYIGEMEWNVLDNSLEIKTVHQLQNLYYALTEKEL